MHVLVHFLAHYFPQLLLFVFLTKTTTIHADFALKENDTVVWLGDSITAEGTCGRIVETYSLLRFPDRNLTFWNAGEGGETLEKSLSRLESDVFSRNPTVVIAAYGINDIGWGTKANAETREGYLQAVRDLASICKSRGVRFIHCSAAITAENPETAEKGFLQEMCDAGLATAKECGAGTIDLQRHMRAVQRRVLTHIAKHPEQKPPATLHHQDGIHLSELGNMAMGYAMLKGLGAEPYTTTLTVDAITAETVDEKNCDARAQLLHGTLCIARKDQSWPLNLHPLWMLSSQFISWTEDINNYELKILNLKPGRYTVAASGRPLGTWDAAAWAKGVNLASATTNGWEPGGLWDAQSQAVFTLTNWRCQLQDLQALRTNFAPLDTNSQEKDATIANLETSIRLLQTQLATPPEIGFEVYPEIPKAAPQKLEKVAVAPDKRSFVQNPSGKAFRPHGLHFAFIQLPNITLEMPDKTRLVEMRELGANLIGVELPLASMLQSPTSIKPEQFARLKRLFREAEELQLRILITGLAPGSVQDENWEAARPKVQVSTKTAWYDALNESDRWAAQETFWKAIAKAGSTSPTIFGYNLANNILLDGGSDAWRLIVDGHFSPQQRLTLAPGTRNPGEIAHSWLAKMHQAIRSQDPATLITLGAYGSNLAPEFLQAPAADMLDFYLLTEFESLCDPAKLSPFLAAPTKPLLGGGLCLVPAEGDDAGKTLLKTLADSPVPFAGLMSSYDGIPTSNRFRQPLAYIPEAVLCQNATLFRKLASHWRQEEK